MPAPLTPAPFDHWPRYQELTELLEAWTAERPQLLTVVSIGRSHEGRDIWMCEVTDESTGPARDKPAVWVDANIHATEVTLVEGYCLPAVCCCRHDHAHDRVGCDDHRRCCR